MPVAVTGRCQPPSGASSVDSPWSWRVSRPGCTAVTPSSLTILRDVLPAQQGAWTVVTGATTGRGRYTPTFLVNTEDGRWVRVETAGRWYPYCPFSARRPARGNVPWLLGGALLMGLANAFATPVQYSFLPELVEPEQLQASLQMNSVTFNIGRVVGPVLGVLTVDRFGYGWAFTVNAISFLALILALLLIVPRPVVRSERRLVVSDLFRLATGNRRVAVLLLMVVAVVMTYDPIQTLAPGLVEQVFKAPSTWVGGLLGALGVGAIVGTLLPNGRPTTHRVAALLGLFGVGMLFYALAPSPQLALAGPLVAGVGYLLSNTGSQGLLFREAGEGQAGQVMALYSMAFVGVRPLISLVDGALADTLGIRQAAVIMTLPALSIAVIAGISLLVERGGSQLALDRS